ncbi:MAG: epimerase, partial [Candidatus Marinimicrobia bacterium]|nr:epimerase [Candidatus Neomarinimicrobiota bacterium]
MKILITGASGFIGMPILERLIHSDEVSEIFALTRKLTQKLPKNKKLKWIETDISEYTSIKLNSRDCNPDILIH